MFDGSRDWQRIGLEGVTVLMQVGVADFEQHPNYHQPVVVDVDLFRFVGRVPIGELADTLDYDRLRRELLEGWPTRPHTDLLETLAEDLLAFCFEDPRVDAARVKLRKPAIYGGRATPVVELFRRRDAGN
ncbi:MAG: dihydroneopterin aldolase [Pseudomonadota bacterium]